MNKNEIRQLADELMNEHLGTNHGWQFKFDNAVVRLGACHWNKKLITLSWPIALRNPETITDTILHEIAHALAGRRAGHNTEWKSKCYAVGARPVRCSDTPDFVRPPARYRAPCPNCGKMIERYRLPKFSKCSWVACGSCCNKYNGGKFSSRYAVLLGDTSPDRNGVVWVDD